MNGKVRIAVVTGDVHHSLGRSQRDKHEYLLALKYAEIAYSMNARITLYVTGKCVNDHTRFVKKLLEDYGEHVELGGHTYWAFHEIPWLPKTLHGLLFPLLGFEYYGPRRLQELDIRKTVKVFKEALGVRIKSWRTHAYQGTPTTYEILDSLGFTSVSDKFSLFKPRVKRIGTNLHQVYMTIPSDDLVGLENTSMTWITGIVNSIN